MSIFYIVFLGMGCFISKLFKDGILVNIKKLY